MTHLTHDVLKPFIDKKSTVLILGTFPSVKSREAGFYYSHKRNRFFLVLSKIFNKPVPNSIEEKKELLRKHHIGLYDIIYECDINNSDDSSIRNAVPIDLNNILDKYPNIKTIGLTGSKASNIFQKYFKNLEEKLNVFYLPSTSPANAKMSTEELVEHYANLFK